MIQKSIYFKHITEDWRCSLVNEYYKKNIDFVVYPASPLSSVRRYCKPGGTEACSAQKIFQI